MRRFAIGLLVLPLMAGCGKDSDKKDGEAADTIVIGHYGSLTGDDANFGQSTKEGLELAIDEINAAGGIDVGGKKMKVVKHDEDTGSLSDQVRPAVQKLLDLPGITAVIGEVASTRSKIGGPLCEKQKVPMISPASTNSGVTFQDGRTLSHVFRVCFIDEFQGAAAATFVAKDLNWKKCGILRDSASDYSKGLAKSFQETFEKLGGKVEITLDYTGGADKDFSSQLTKFKGAGLDGLFIPGYYGAVALIANQARTLGVNDAAGKPIAMVGGDGWDGADLFNIGKNAVDGCYITNHAAPDDPSLKEFEAKYRKKFNKQFDSMAVLGYDTMMLLADAIKRAGSTDRAKVRDAIEKTKGFPGLSGTITIDERHNASKPITILKIEKGAFKFVKRVDP